MDPDVAALEANIDKNPLNPMNHYLLADKHRELGNEDEADFRQAMGDWVTKNPNVDMPPSGLSDPGYFAGGKLGYPKGVALEHMDFPRQPGYPQAPHIQQGQPEHYPSAHRHRDEGDTPTGGFHISWRTYRGMEEAFRRAHRVGKQNQQPEQLSRRIRARRMMKSTGNR